MVRASKTIILIWGVCAQEGEGVCACVFLCMHVSMNVCVHACICERVADWG